MCANWNKNFQHDQITNRLEKIKTITNNKASFKAFEYKEYEAILESMIEFKSDVPIYLKRRLIWEGVKYAAVKGIITTKNLISAISRKEKEFLEKKPKSYILITHLTIQNNITLPNVNFPNAYITFKKYLPNNFKNNRVKQEIAAKSFVKNERPKNSLVARIRVNAREEYEASNIALDNLDFYRSLINFHLTSSFRYSFGGPNKPVNVVLLGPVHTLHNLNGTLATEIFWYQPEFNTTKNINLSLKHRRLIEEVNYLRQKIKLLQYANKLKNVFVRYVRSMDYSDYNTAFIQLWGVLEILTNTEKESYDTTIKRVTSLFEDYKYHRQVLNHLRFYRNNMVHRGVVYNDIEPYIYQLKRYIDQLLVFIINNYFGFKSFNEIAEFMDIPLDESILLRKLSLYRTAIKFRNINK